MPGEKKFHLIFLKASESSRAMESNCEMKQRAEQNESGFSRVNNENSLPTRGWKIVIKFYIYI